MMMDVFISYKSEDRKQAVHIKRVLSANGLTCWMDKEQIKIGEDYEKVIAEIMPQCCGMVLLLSDLSQQSKEVKIEFELAKKHKVKIFPIKIEECELTEYYDRELKHINIAMDYASGDELLKNTVLEEIRDQVYEVKGMTVKTVKDLQRERICYYEKELLKEYQEIMQTWNQTITKAVERCGFLTPEPEYMMEVIGSQLSNYYEIVDDYVSDVLCNCYEGGMIDSFIKFVEKIDLTKVLWMEYKSFKKIVLERLTYLEYEEEYKDSFLSNIYKDYIKCLRNEVLQHPIIRLLKAGEKLGGARFELLMAAIRQEHQTEFFSGDSPAVFVDLDYIGDEYVNFNGAIRVSSERIVFKPEDIKTPEWFDFVRKYYAEQLLSEPDLNVKMMRDFVKQNPTISYNGEINHMYIYVARRLAERERIKMLKTYITALIEDYRYVSVEYMNNFKKSSMEMEKMKKLITLCMQDNGYDHEEIENVQELFLQV